MGFVGSAVKGVWDWASNPSVSQHDPTNPRVKGLQGDLASFLQGVVRDPVANNPFGGMTSDLQRSSMGGIQQFLTQNPESQVNQSLNQGLLDMFAMNSASQVGEAAMPLFQRGLQTGLGQLASSAPGRFGTTFESQGIDLTSRAMQDFNLLQQQAFMQNQQNRLGAAGLLQQGQQNQFQNLLQGGQLGLQATAQQVNPLLALLQGAMQFGAPVQQDTVVGDSYLGFLSNAAAAAAAAGGG